MTHTSNICGLACGIVMSCLATSAAAASLQPVSNWAKSAVPADVSMYAYVPDDVAEKPPVLLLVHYCGGTADAVFGQARGGGIVEAADKYGFIMVVPSSGRCWDVVSNKTRTRDGGGDSDAIMQMVEHALSTYQANADRVYVTGDSSGGMMTELLLALHPEVFKAGAAFAGMPAGCRGAGESGNGGGYSGACAGGTVTHTPQEWAEIARSLAPGYMGRRPRVQLVHGDADDIIKYPNHTEAIKEWSAVLGLPPTPTATEMGVTLGKHQATRQRWTNACGYETLDALTSIGGDHGPSDALFDAKFVIPFLGLDDTGPRDPEVVKCEGSGNGGNGGGGSGGAGGAGGSGGGGGGVQGGASGNAGSGAAGAPISGSASGGSSPAGAGGYGGGVASAGAPPLSAGSAGVATVPTSDGGSCSFRASSSTPFGTYLLALAGLLSIAMRRSTRAAYKSVRCASK
jgi:poly(hydroxyalkanoate) depolymerase family esterase